MHAAGNTEETSRTSQTNQATGGKLALEFRYGEVARSARCGGPFG